MKTESRPLRKGILGGTFDPIHNGHLEIARAAASQLDLSCVILLPSGFSYFKAGREDKMQPPVIRYRMSVLAAGTDSIFTASDIETSREGNTYTYETLQIFHLAEPETSFYFIIGADAFMEIRTWAHPEEIFRLCTLAVCRRNNQVDASALSEEAAYLSETYGAFVELIDSPDIAVSSAEIRKRIRTGQSISGLVPSAVEKYINENRLYRPGGLS
ncbi:MAG: nicotinate-nucleotide adenylyltransferase [Lachnospiraceae bacterium]|nr:nicotinate-nucleotide adenylyltransferase [Lachnospiraceae bacterium]